MKKPFSIQLLIFFFLIYAGCRDDAPVEIEPPEYTYTVPSQRNDGWATSSLEEAGLNSQNISDLVNFLYRQRSHKIHSILIAKNERIVFEKYFSGYKFNNNIVQTDNDLINYDIDTLNFFANGTKSITCLIAGMMINEGYNLRLDDQIKKY